MAAAAAFRGICCTRGSSNFAIRSLASASPLRLRHRRNFESLEPRKKWPILATLMKFVTSLLLIEDVAGSRELSVGGVNACQDWAWSLAVLQGAQ